MSFEDQVFLTTVRLEVPNSSGNVTVGTGFFLEMPSPRPGRHVLLLISAKHVLNNPLQIVHMLLNKRGISKDHVELGKPINYLAQYKEAYFEHPSLDIDLACVNVSNVLSRQDIMFKNLQREMFADFTESWLMAGRQVLLVGYPENRYDEANNLPILRTGTIASLPKVDFDGKPQFLIDAQVFPGSSGSPVFMNNGTEWRFLGTVVSTMIRNQRVDFADVAAGPVTQQILGLGLVYKAPTIVELAQHALKRISEMFSGS
ncbi:MAG: trypsin-like peptidase domain-containing protein [Chloroflexi bacterium]|nr:trypsin-like peptidase domain-containing protein [Chloroflexota bacterium]